MCSPDLPDMPEMPTIRHPVDENVVNEMKDRRRKARRGAGHSGTILTSGLDEPESIQPTLLGG